MEARKAFAEQGVMPFSKDIGDCLGKIAACETYEKGVISERLVTEAFEPVGLKPTPKNIRKYISGYARDKYLKNGALNDSLAEGFSSEEPNDVTKYIQDKMKGW